MFSYSGIDVPIDHYSFDFNLPKDWYRNYGKPIRDWASLAVAGAALYYAKKNYDLNKRREQRERLRQMVSPAYTYSDTYMYPTQIIYTFTSPADVLMSGVGGRFYGVIPKKIKSNLLRSPGFQIRRARARNFASTLETGGLPNVARRIRNQYFINE